MLPHTSLLTVLSHLYAKKITQITCWYRYSYCGLVLVTLRRKEIIIIDIVFWSNSCTDVYTVPWFNYWKQSHKYSNFGMTLGYHDFTIPLFKNSLCLTKPAHPMSKDQFKIYVYINLEQMCQGFPACPANKSVTQDFILSGSTACIFINSFTVLQEHLLHCILAIIICNQWASYYWHTFLKIHTWHIKGFLLSNTISLFNQQIATLSYFESTSYNSLVYTTYSVH